MRCGWCHHVWWNGHLDEGECIQPDTCPGSGPLKEMVTSITQDRESYLGPPGGTDFVRPLLSVFYRGPLGAFRDTEVILRTSLLGTQREYPKDSTSPLT